MRRRSQVDAIGVSLSLLLAGTAPMHPAFAQTVERYLDRSAIIEQLQKGNQGRPQGGAADSISSGGATSGSDSSAANSLQTERSGAANANRKTVVPPVNNSVPASKKAPSSSPKGPSGPSVELFIEFEFNSAKLTLKAEKQLDELAGALKVDAFKGKRLFIAGHTDSKGSAVYNKELSLRRAESVRIFLVSKHQFSLAGIDVAGFGEEQLKDPSQPDSAENRRVEVELLG